MGEVDSERHELRSYFEQAQAVIASEYARISSRVREDPGTAGDEGEQNWADLLSEFLPSDLPVVTKGRIVGPNGDASPQVDVVVLESGYPQRLRHSKMYLARGVVAAFECKLTLRAEHVPKLFETASSLARLLPAPSATPEGELLNPIIYGLLAHSHSWPDCAAAETALDKRIVRAHTRCFMQGHPRELPDLICVASGPAYFSNIVALYPVPPDVNPATVRGLEGASSAVASAFMRWTPFDASHEGGPVLPAERPNAVGVGVEQILRRLARGHSAYAWLREAVRESEVTGGGASISLRLWAHAEVFSEELRHAAHNLSETEGNPAWSVTLP